MKDYKIAVPERATLDFQLPRYCHNIIKLLQWM